STALIGTAPSFVGLSILLFGAAMVALVVRYRSGAPDLRQQIKWVAFAGVAALVCQAALGIAQAASGSDSLATSLAGVAAGFVALLGIPVAIPIAILRYRVYDIDVIITRAVVYGLLAAAVTAVYALVVIGVGSLVGYGLGNPVLTTAAAVAIALLFQPA